MFTPKKILILLLIGIGLTVLLYYIDTDPPIDDIWKRLGITTAITLVVFIFFSVFYLVFQGISYLTKKLSR